MSEIVDSDNLHPLVETSHVSILSAVDFSHAPGGGGMTLANNSEITRSSYDMNDIDQLKPLNIPKITETPHQREGLLDTSSKSFSSQGSNSKNNQLKKTSQVTAKSESPSADKPTAISDPLQEVEVTHSESIEMDEAQGIYDDGPCCITVGEVRIPCSNEGITCVYCWY